ncbi:MAG TPA: hypothetical protein VF288_06915 [Mycobacteriales bacterium]
MNIEDRLDRVRDELADEVKADVRVPSFAGVLARRARRRRLQAAAGGAAVVVVAAAVVGGLAATRPGPHHAVPPAVTVSVSPSPSPTGSPTTAPSTAQTYPAPGASYVVVPDGDQLAWTDLKTGAHGHFGPTDGSQLSDPSVSADGRRVAYMATVSPAQTEIAVWDLGTGRGTTLATFAGSPSAPSISPDGTRVIWAESGAGIEMATVAAPSPAPPALLPNIQNAAWDGNDALAYLPADEYSGGQCAVVRVELSKGSPTQCLLPMATLDSVFAADGSTWHIDGIAASVSSNLFALTLFTNDGGTRRAQRNGLGILNPDAEATSLHVLAPSALVSPVLLDRGSRVLGVEFPVAGPTGAQDQPIVGTVVSVEVATGKKTTLGITTRAGVGATSG